MSQVTELNQKSALAESYRTVRTNISFADIDNNLKTIMFTSTKQGEGKSTTISHLAHTFSKLENTKVLVLDLDLRNPNVHKMFSVSNTYGLMDNLKNDRPLEKCIHKIEENIHVLPTGSMPPNPAEVLSSKKMAHFLKNIKTKYDYIFIDMHIKVDSTLNVNEAHKLVHDIEYTLSNKLDKKIDLIIHVEPLF